MNTFRFARLAVLAVPLVACGVDHTGIHTAGSMKLASEACLRSALCYDLGRHYMKMSTQSMSLDWDEPFSLEKARAVWMWACHHGEGTSCRAMVEFGAVKTDLERQLYTLRASFYSTPV